MQYPMAPHPGFTLKVYRIQPQHDNILCRVSKGISIQFIPENLGTSGNIGIYFELSRLNCKSQGGGDMFLPPSPNGTRLIK